MTNDFYNGMLKFEQLCEKLLVESDLKKETQTYIQIAILDKAQAIIEAWEEEQSMDKVLFDSCDIVNTDTEFISCEFCYRYEICKKAKEKSEE